MMTHSHHNHPRHSQYEAQRMALIADLIHNDISEKHFQQARLTLELRCFGRRIARQQKAAVAAELAYVRANRAHLMQIAAARAQEQRQFPATCQDATNPQTEPNRRAVMASLPMFAVAWIFANRRQ